MFFKDFVSVKRKKIKKGASQTYDTPSFVSIIFRCNMWMLLIVKLLSFKRYNYPFYKCRESGRQMQCAYSQSVSDKVVPLLFSLFCKILETNAMHCFSASSVSCVTERLSGCKDTDLYWIRANYYLKKYYSTVAFFDNFNRTTSCIFMLQFIQI